MFERVDGFQQRRSPAMAVTSTTAGRPLYHQVMLGFFGMQFLRVNQKKNGISSAHDRLTPREDVILIRLTERMEKKSWVKVKLHLSHRSISSIRNRYQRLTRTHLFPPKQKCRLCGEFRRGHICTKAFLCHEVFTETEDLPPLRFDFPIEYETGLDEL